MRDKRFLLVLIISGFSLTLLSQNCQPADSQYSDEIQAYRDSVNLVFGDSEHSILKQEDQMTFEGLNYYDINDDLRVCAKFKRHKKPVEFEMQTSTSRKPKYIPYGVLKFKVNGKKETLTVYQNVALSKKEEYLDYLFVPFTDQTNGFETYGGGRYLDFSVSDLKDPVIDFNLCYNPYCAYNDKFSCPIPPLENHLKMEIKAGVKKWHD